jgi:CopG family nickel-responsive transcriptional regulator
MEEREMVRFGVSIPAGLLAKFDALIEAKGYTSRSEALRDLIRDDLVSTAWEQRDGHGPAIGTITIVYDHHAREIADRLVELAHDHLDLIISSMHAHLAHDACVEVLLVRGPQAAIQSLSDRLISTRGVKHGRLVVTGLVDTA